VPSHVKFTDQLKALKDPRVLKYCQYYSIVFGGYVALSLWMVQYYVGEFGLDIRWAALLAACFSLPGGVLRAIGGWLSDKFGAHSVTWWVMWVSWICLFLLSYPQTDMTILTVDGPKTFHIGLNVYSFTALMFILGIAWAFGKASTFKYISDEYPENIAPSAASSAWPVASAARAADHVGALMDLTGIRSSASMLMYGVVWVSLIWMYWTEVRKTEMMASTPRRRRSHARRRARLATDRQRCEPTTFIQRIGEPDSSTHPQRHTAWPEFRTGRQRTQVLAGDRQCAGLAHLRRHDVLADLLVRNLVRDERGGRAHAGHRLQVHDDGAVLAGGHSRLGLGHPAADHANFIPVLGTRPVISISTIIKIVPMIWLGYAVQDLNTSWATFMVIGFPVRHGRRRLLVLHASTSIFFPKRLQGTAMASRPAWATSACPSCSSSRRGSSALRRWAHCRRPARSLPRPTQSRAR